MRREGERERMEGKRSIRGREVDRNRRGREVDKNRREGIDEGREGRWWFDIDKYDF